MTKRLETEHWISIPTIPKKALPLNPTAYNPQAPKRSSERRGQNEVLESLLYINRSTRSEISVHVNLLGRRTASPSQSNMTAAMYVLMSSKEEGITLTKPARKPRKDKGTKNLNNDRSLHMPHTEENRQKARAGVLLR